MSSESRLDLTPLTVRLAALWVLAGALLKLITGTPADLPPVLHELPMSIDLFFKLAIGIELALVLMAFMRPKLAWLPMAVLLLIFDVILSLTLGEASCGCFGSSVAMPPAAMMAIDTVLLFGILFSRPWKSESKGFGPMRLLAVMAIVLLVFPTFYVGDQTIKVTDEDPTAQIEDKRYIILDLESWKDQLIFDTDFAALFPAEMDTLPLDGDYIFWRWDCDHCAKHFIKLTNEDDMTKPFVLIRLNQESDNEANQAVLVRPSGSHVTDLSLPAGPQYVVETPAAFVLEGGMVVRAEEGVGKDE